MKTMVVTAALLAAFAQSGQAGLLDLFGPRGSTKNPELYGRIVSMQKSVPARLAVQDALPPIPAGEAPPATAIPNETVVAPIALYPRVKVEDRDNIHPCAVPMIVQVMDPCPPRFDPHSCCKPKPGCVFVKVCVPPCKCPPRIKVSRGGARVEYDYGEYEVEITSKKGVVYVNYDD